MAVFSFGRQNATPVAIPDATGTGPARLTQTIDVFVTGFVLDVDVTLSLTHTFASDLDVVLVAPDPSRSATLLSDVGDNGDLNATQLTFDGTSQTALPLTNAPIVSGTYRNTNQNQNGPNGGGNPTETPEQFGLAPGTSLVTSLTQVAQTQALGAWSLVASDDTFGDTGSLGDWSITITTSQSSTSIAGTSGNDQLTFLSLTSTQGLLTLNGVTAFYSDLIATSFASDGGQDTVTGGEGIEIVTDSDLLDGDAFNGNLGADSLFYTGDFVAAGQTEITFDMVNGTALANNGASEGIGGFDTLSTGNSNDTIIGSSFGNHLSGNAGHDNIQGGGGNDSLFGGTGNDTLDGGADTDLVTYGGGLAITLNLSLTTAQATPLGLDTLLNVENLIAGTGDYNLIGSAANNSLSTRDGDDTLHGGAGNDLLYAGNGTDALTGGSGDDLIDGGGNLDRVFFSGAIGVTVNLALTGGQDTGYGIDRILNVENITSGNGGDDLRGNALANSISSGAGADFVLGGGGDDALFGGADDDFLKGEADHDDLFGGAQDDILRGDAGNDSLDGGSGDDRLYGGEGSDRLTGGAGLDRFVFDAGIAVGQSDRILDFTAADDVIHLAQGLFSGIAATGALDAAAFAANLTGLAGDATDRVIFETDTGRLFYDADGTGATGRILFATLAPNLTLTSADFLVF